MTNTKESTTNTTKEDTQIKTPKSNINSKTKQSKMRESKSENSTDREECPECGYGGELNRTVAGDEEWGCPACGNSWWVNSGDETDERYFTFE